MRLRDFFAEALEYSAVDKAAQEEAEKAIAAKPPTLGAARKIGRCANGFERGKGHIFHAVPPNSWSALCGAQPGRQSAGWNSEPDPQQAVTCPRCLKKLTPR